MCRNVACCDQKSRTVSTPCTSGIREWSRGGALVYLLVAARSPSADFLPGTNFRHLLQVSLRWVHSNYSLFRQSVPVQEKILEEERDPNNDARIRQPLGVELLRLYVSLQRRRCKLTSETTATLSANDSSSIPMTLPSSIAFATAVPSETTWLRCCTTDMTSSCSW